MPAAARTTRTDQEIDVLMRAAQVLAAITAESTAQVGAAVTPPQLRVLVLASTEGPLNNKAVASALNVHLSNASRISDRLVQAGLLDRRDSPTDRRNVELTATREGRRLISAVMRHRQAALTDILQHMSPDARRALVAGLEDFNRAAE